MRNVLYWRERPRPLRTDGGDTTVTRATMLTGAQVRKVLSKMGCPLSTREQAGVLHVTWSGPTVPTDMAGTQCPCQPYLHTSSELPAGAKWEGGHEWAYKRIREPKMRYPQSAPQTRLPPPPLAQLQRRRRWQDGTANSELVTLSYSGLSEAGGKPELVTQRGRYWSTGADGCGTEGTDVPSDEVD